MSTFYSKLNATERAKIEKWTETMFEHEGHDVLTTWEGDPYIQREYIWITYCKTCKTILGMSYVPVRLVQSLVALEFVRDWVL